MLQGFTPKATIVRKDGDCFSPARAALVCSTRELSDDEQRTIRLIRKLVINDHTSPFEHCGAQFTITCSIVCSRQWIRHRTASYNENSDRIGKHRKGIAFDEQFIESLEGGENEALAKSMDEIFGVYQSLIDRGVSIDKARRVLPIGLPTRLLVTGNLLYWRNFIRLRRHFDADYEIRSLATQIDRTLFDTFPILWPLLREKLTS